MGKNISLSCRFLWVKSAVSSEPPRQLAVTPGVASIPGETFHVIKKNGSLYNISYTL